MRERRSNGLSEPSADKHQSEASPPSLLFENGSPGRSGFYWPVESEKGQTTIPKTFLREDIPGFPELGELEVLHHEVQSQGQRSGGATSRLCSNSSFGSCRVSPRGHKATL